MNAQTFGTITGRGGLGVSSAWAPHSAEAATNIAMVSLDASIIPYDSFFSLPASVFRLHPSGFRVTGRKRLRSADLEGTPLLGGVHVQAASVTEESASRAVQAVHSREPEVSAPARPKHDWLAALDRARIAFAENEIVPPRKVLRVAAELELQLAAILGPAGHVSQSQRRPAAADGVGSENDGTGI